MCYAYVHNLYRLDEAEAVATEVQPVHNETADPDTESQRKKGKKNKRKQRQNKDEDDDVTSVQGILCWWVL